MTPQNSLKILEKFNIIFCYYINTIALFLKIIFMKGKMNNSFLLLDEETVGKLLNDVYTDL